MNTHIKAALATFGGAAALVWAVGFGPVGVNTDGSTPSPATHSSPSVLTTTPGSGVTHATLTGCISGENC
ncbi:hypothetical protein [Mycobacterium parmense]|uniref:Uncharacterized protein n=1 Tax=Mycobacterium parmense TaxID=185642 RepID=A0A7I7YQ55_9MYCO|nr:hypothetical protein [Mycobacterium parmense]MCV7353435.1 hypothetical protein [Mycobacterium parmense]ORW51543.1 hypothetical protein AWC20_22550 [Mycobacterium parmense]BBZ44005.1 hypothetical protein MPRM_12860 [Mycobacterium parmense]